MDILEKNIRIGKRIYSTFHATMDIYLLYLSDCLAEKSTQIKTAFLSTAPSFYADRATYISSNECESPYLFD